MKIKIALSKLYSYIFNDYKVLDKIAFYINEPYMFDHYKNVIERLSPSVVVLIYSEKFKTPENYHLISNTNNKGWEGYFLDEIFYKYKFRVLITHIFFGGASAESENFIARIRAIILKIRNMFFNKIGIPYSRNASSGLYFQKILGVYNIRYMYGLDNGGDKLGEWNYLFDYFFCHGPFDANIMLSAYNKPVFIMGYPRYDNYLENRNDRQYKSKIQNKFGCDSNKLTILIVCTVSPYFSTIINFADEINKLSQKYNVILRPHPLEINPKSERFNKAVYEVIKNGKFIVNDDPSQDMSNLYMAADIVMCDYGGSVFSAIYLSDNVILLNDERSLLDPSINVDSAREIRKIIPGIYPDSTISLSTIIEDKIYLSENSSSVELARSIFYNKVEVSAPRTSQMIMELFNRA